MPSPGALPQAFILRPFRATNLRPLFDKDPCLPSDAVEVVSGKDERMACFSTRKFEIRMSNSETNAKFEIQMFQNSIAIGIRFEFSFLVI
jgi:hypothetical protein